jgi:uncharacterized damage-inducible protein DinB
LYPPAGSSASNSLVSSVRCIFERDLRALRREVEAYPADDLLWRPVPGLTNVAGTLALHIAGNVQHFLGACLGSTGYVRHRDAEFAQREVARATILAELDLATEAVRAGLSSLRDAQLADDFPDIIGGMRFQTGDYLLHLTTHLAYHLGQVDYHRRMVTASEQAIGAMRTTELSSARSSEETA